MALTACKREVRRKLLRKTSNQVLKISTYQLGRSVKVMVTDEHPIFGHRLEGLLIQVDEETDGILICASRHKYSEIIGIKVVHVRNRRLHLVKGAPTVDDFQSTSRLGTTMPVEGWILSCGGTYVLSTSWSCNLFLLSSVYAGLGGSIEAAATPDRAFSPILSTFGGLQTGIPSSRDAPASLGVPSKAD